MRVRNRKPAPARRRWRRRSIATIGAAISAITAAVVLTVMLVLKAVLPTGGGQVRWAPQQGRPLSSWDFEVEID